ncbi:TetR/AcrR family transcriptional regulator [Lactiplantibacillus plantarum]|uniref:TetR/AcrR family transcriptional regulator n=1 Tax=Lactiplantibacillus plantarum TaxID=1590 RepID=UPI0032E4219E
MRKDAQINQQKILTAARQLFAARSIETVSMKDIATAAGIGPGTLYRHYAHKSTLCLALVTDRVATFIKTNQVYLTTTSVGAAALFDHVIGEYLAIREHNMALLMNVEAGEPGRRQFYQSELYQQLCDLLTQLVRDLKPTLSKPACEFQADMLIAMLKGTSYAFQRQWRGRSQSELLAQLHALMVTE